VEAGVPTYLVDVIAGATGEETANEVMDLVGVSPTTFRRKVGGEGAAAGRSRPPGGGLPARGCDASQAAAGKRRCTAVKEVDLESWIAGWMREELPELGVKTPAEMLRNPEGSAPWRRCSNA